MYLIFDTETTGLPKSFSAPISDSDNWPRLVQLAWQLHDKNGELLSYDSLIIKPEGFDIPYNSVKIHGITNEKAQKEGIELKEVLALFEEVLAKCDYVIGHNLAFDLNILGAEHYRLSEESKLPKKLVLDTKDLSTDFCAIPGGRGGKYKWPKLGELYLKLFGHSFDEAHNAAADVNATARSFFELARLGIISAKQMGWDNAGLAEFKTRFPDVVEDFDIKIEKQINAGKSKAKAKPIAAEIEISEEFGSPFFHFHNHSSFSVLSATSKVTDLVKAAKEQKMPAVGLTDAGNMMGAFHFMNAIKKENASLATPIVPILGCEFYISEHYTQTKFTKDNPDRRYTQLLLAKNKNGYRNLSKISSIGFVKGYYSGFPRVGKEVIEEYKQDLIATTGSITSEIPQTILNLGEQAGEEIFCFWHKLFGDDFYVEIIRHGLEDENYVNDVLINLAKKYEVKILAQNNTFYIEQKDAEAHDILLCVRDGEKKDTPIGKGRDFRFGFPNEEFYFKSAKSMAELFHDIPESIENLQAFLEKFEPYTLNEEVLLPAFDIPEEFKNLEDEKDKGHRGENAFLRHLAYKGAETRYPEMTEEIKSRMDFELETIEKTGYPGYFLIVQDFTSQARKMGVSVGPGRGSAAGSLVAYCTGITNVDPIKYDLLFERFLNPDRISLPDIDIDFDDRGRDKIIEWVVNKYGGNRVAQIITFGTMAGKSAIRDTGRVLGLHLSETDKLAKKIHTSLNNITKLSEKELKEKIGADGYEDSKYILDRLKENTLESETIRQATIIEGSIRNTGTHACGVIITPIDLQELVPVTVAKDATLLVTQFDNSVVEEAGLLKMDFLGLKTLTIIKDAVDLVEKTTNKKLDPDTFPLDDSKTYEIFQNGQTVGIFQYESAGMQKHLKSLKPDKFDDLIAMNALYRPGPIQYIPNFIARKHGKEQIAYDLADMEEYLADTYGITVYQEQVMLLSQKLAGFSKGMADALRKGMGKKKKEDIDKLYPEFIEGGTKNGHPKEKLDKIWKDWEAFASYAFNKSHSTCYALIAFQTAYLKAHYPAQYMAAVLSNNMSNIKMVTFFMDECKRMGMDVLGPDVNESSYNFSVNEKGAVRFGMGAIKGVGQAAVEKIIAEREENGVYANVFDFVKRIDLRSANKKTIENLVMAGAFDDFDSYHRAQFFYESEGSTNLEKLIKFGSTFQENQQSAQASLFGGASEEDTDWQNPTLLDCAPWTSLQKLLKEREVVGVYISAHPLSEFRQELIFSKCIGLKDFKSNEERFLNREFNVGGIILEASHRVSSKDGKGFGTFTLEDFEDQYEFRLFGEDYLKWKHLLNVNQFLQVRISVTKNKYSGKVYTNIIKFNLLENILEEQCKRIVLKIDINLLDEEKTNQLIELIELNPGESSINLVFDDPDNKLSIQMPSRKVKVKIEKELLQTIEALDFLQLSLN